MNDELREEILELINDDERKEGSYLEKLGQDLRSEIHDYCSLTKEFRERMSQMESMIHGHAIGVQNVYAEVKKVQDALQLVEVKKLVRYIENYDSARIKNEIEKIHKFMNSDYVAEAIQEFKHFKYELIELIQRGLK